MAGFKLTLQCNRAGEPIPFAELVYGHFGKFIGDADGEVEIEVDDYGEGATFLVPMCITDPRDGQRVSHLGMYQDEQSGVVLEMSVNARFTPPSSYTPPSEV